MPIGLMGRKCGMMRLFTDAGIAIGVTVVEVLPNRLTQIKTLESDGYHAIQITRGKKRASINRPMSGHYAKAGVEAGDILRDICLEEEDLAELKVGDELKVDLFAEGQQVNVRSLIRVKGFLAH